MGMFLTILNAKAIPTLWYEKLNNKTSGGTLI